MTQFSEVSKGRYVNISLVCTITIGLVDGIVGKIPRSAVCKMINGYDIHLDASECVKMLMDINVVKGIVE